MKFNIALKIYDSPCANIAETFLSTSKISKQIHRGTGAPREWDSTLKLMAKFRVCFQLIINEKYESSTSCMCNTENEMKLF